jgi:succinate dehydrogenase / fumarate reductase cytochrome b subunit
MAHSERPLSPHLQVYKPQITTTMSILHRITGVALSLGGISLVWWLMSIAIGGSAYEFAMRQWASPVGLIFLFGFTLALVYHLLNGIRHLLWDAGWGYDIPAVYKSGYAVFVVGFLVTGLIWFFGMRGAA